MYTKLLVSLALSQRTRCRDDHEVSGMSDILRYDTHPQYDFIFGAWELGDILSSLDIIERSIISDYCL